MNVKLFFSAVIKFFIGVLLVGMLVFLPAGTLSFINGWILMTILFVPMLIAGIVMMFKNPALLAKRLDAKEKRGEQNLVVKLSGLMFILGFVAAGLDFRFEWLRLPDTVVIASAVIFLVGYTLYAEVLRENTYLSRTVKVQENQKVVDTGLYGIVRHPMYSVTLLLFLSMPLVLGSVFSFVIFLAYPLIIAKRIRNEEEFLEKELEGYAKSEEYENNPIFIMMNSKARGSISNFVQLAGMRGIMAKPSGEPVEIPILSSFSDGLSVSEFFLSTHGARKGSADTALKTADSGYMTRRLVDVAHDIIVREEDCHTTQGVKVSAFKDDKDGIIEPFYERIVGRFTNKKVINPETKEVICEKEIDQIENEN